MTIMQCVRASGGNRARRAMHVVGALALGLALAAVGASAQQRTGRWSGVVAVGAAVPSSAVSEHSSTGAAGDLGIERWNHDGSEGLRIEALGGLFRGGRYAKACTQNGCGGRPKVAAAMADVILGASDSLRVRHGIGGYALAGVGVASTNALVGGITPGGFVAFETQSQSGFAWNMGLGLRLPFGMDRWFLEARYLNVPGPTGRAAVWPIVVGLEF